MLIQVDDPGRLFALFAETFELPVVWPLAWYGEFQSGGVFYGGLIGGILVIFYFFMIRPQQKKLKEHRRLVSELRKGDKVITAGGLHATVTKIEDDHTLILEIAPNVRVKAQRHTISELASKPEPRGANDDAKAAKS